jgi:hypothetical protein
MVMSPDIFGISALDAVVFVDLADWLQECQLMSDLIRQHLLHAKQRMKKQADCHRSERQFQECDQVFLKLQPYVQSSLAARASQKLAFKYFGPLKVLVRVDRVAYRLELPSSSSIHLVFHISSGAGLGFGRWVVKISNGAKKNFDTPKYTLIAHN